MGALTSRQHNGVEEIDPVSNHAYRYPPRSGNYFGSHFIMGGERFDTPQPESYLFGENSDLNFLGSRPTPFPYPPPQPNEPTKTLKSLVNIRKESLRFVRAPLDHANNKVTPPHDLGTVELGNGGKSTPFNIEFTFDSDVRCAITIYYFCTEEMTPNGVTYVQRDSAKVSETYHYKKGANQQFCQMSHVFDPSKHREEDLLYDVDREMIPIAIHCVAEEGNEDSIRQSHTTVATVEKLSDGTYVLKALKQKLFVDGLCYLLQEIYGIENKNNDVKASGDDDTEDNGSECVICMCDVRDTLILPCRHLCLCNSCADSLRYQANNCPICRAPFRALLQIRALQKCSNSAIPAINPPDGSCENIPPGYEAVSLIEALNGPCLPRQPPTTAMPDLVDTPDSERAIQAAQILNRGGNDHTPPGSIKNSDYGVLMTTRDDDSKDTKSPLLPVDNPTPTPNKSNKTRPNKHIAEKEFDNSKDDEDSEAEKLSPLLQRQQKSTAGGSTTLALNMADTVEPIDETERENLSRRHSQKNKYGSGGGDDSDYYTPEDPSGPNSTPGGPLYDETVSSVDSTPQRMPGTPMSHASGRSSGDSYTSGASTRHLLAVASNNGSNERGVHI